jgi:hypothetical protein
MFGLLAWDFDETIDCFRYYNWNILYTQSSYLASLEMHTFLLIDLFTIIGKPVLAYCFIDRSRLWWCAFWWNWIIYWTLDKLVCGDVLLKIWDPMIDDESLCSAFLNEHDFKRRLVFDILSPPSITLLEEICWLDFWLLMHSWKSYSAFIRSATIMMLHYFQIPTLKRIGISIRYERWSIFLMKCMLSKKEVFCNEARNELKWKVLEKTEIVKECVCERSVSYQYCFS